MSNEDVKLDDEPIEDGYPFGMEQDSLAGSLGQKIPNRSLMIVSGPVGSGKSLMGQRFTYGLIRNDAKVVVVTTELTTRGWLEQMHSLGYEVTDAVKRGQLIVISRFGTMAEPVMGVGLDEVLNSKAMDEADMIVLDSGSSLLPKNLTMDEQYQLLQKLRKFCSKNRTLMITIDPDDVDDDLELTLRSSSEVLLDMTTALIGGALNRTIVVTRYLRAAGPIQTSVGWRVEPGMGFIVDITAVS